VRRPLSFVTSIVLLLGFAIMPGRASSHREAPLISNDPQADHTDVYAFVSPDAPDTVTMIASLTRRGSRRRPELLPLRRQRPLRDQDRQQRRRRRDITYQFRFTSQVNNPNTFLYATARSRRSTPRRATCTRPTP